MSTGAVIVLIVGAALLVAGAAFLVVPGGIATANDTRGPKWLRNFSMHGPDRARPGRTGPGAVRLLGGLLSVMGIVLVVLSLVVKR